MVSVTSVNIKAVYRMARASKLGQVDMSMWAVLKMGLDMVGVSLPIHLEKNKLDTFLKENLQKLVGTESKYDFFDCSKFTLYLFAISLLEKTCCIAI